jgi:DNA-binding NtrC family response regulator
MTGPQRRVPCIVVAAGPDAGQRLVLSGHAPLLIGRGRHVDLVLSDPGVSREHIEVRATPSGAHVRACDGARAIVVGDRELREADICTGDRIIVGNSILVLAETVVDSPPMQTGVTTTSVNDLLSGLSGELLGISAIYELNEALARAHDNAAIHAVMTAWALTHARCESVTIEGGSDLTNAAAELIERSAPTGTMLEVPEHAGVPARIIFHSREPPDRLSDSLRRLLVLAAALCGASLARVRERESIESDRESLRQLAIGSARGFLGTSPAAEQVARLIRKLAASDVAVLLTGETGTGKSFVARLLHESGRRASEPFRVLNCASIPENLVESELFGHERGAFTGAVASRAGALEAAGVGTLFLDEIGELPLTSQAKLLRVLEDKRFERLGSNRSIEMKARVLTATNRDLQQMVDAGTFRRDLFFRISVVNVPVASLRERAADIPMLARHVVADFRQSTGRRIKGIAPDAIALMQRYSWPGNVRELRNAIEHAIALGEGSVIEVADLPPAIGGYAAPLPSDDTNPLILKLPATLDVLEQRAIQAALIVCGGNRTRAAAILGVTRSTLYNRLAAIERRSPV